jgi:hypothetical protein
LAIWTSAAQVMGKRRAESQTWQFDSRPLNVGNRPLPDLRIKSTICCWERSRRGLQVWFRPRRNQTSQSGVMSSQSPGTPTGQCRDNFETPTWESREKEPFGCSPRGVS